MSVKTYDFETPAILKLRENKSTQNTKILYQYSFHASVFKCLDNPPPHLHHHTDTPTHLPISTPTHPPPTSHPPHLRDFLFHSVKKLMISSKYVAEKTSNESEMNMEGETSEGETSEGQTVEGQKNGRSNVRRANVRRSNDGRSNE